MTYARSNCTPLILGRIKATLWASYLFLTLTHIGLFNPLRLTYLYDKSRAFSMREHYDYWPCGQHHLACIRLTYYQLRNVEHDRHKYPQFNCIIQYHQLMIYAPPRNWPPSCHACLLHELERVRDDEGRCSDFGIGKITTIFRHNLSSKDDTCPVHTPDPEARSWDGSSSCMT